MENELKLYWCSDLSLTVSQTNLQRKCDPSKKLGYVIWNNSVNITSVNSVILFSPWFHPSVSITLIKIIFFTCPPLLSKISYFTLMSWCRRSEDNTLRVTCEWQCREWYDKYGCDYFSTNRIARSMQNASVHIHGLAIAIFTCWYIWPLVIRYCVSSVPVAEWFRKLDYLTIHTSLSLMRRGFAPGFVNYKKGTLNTQTQVIKLTSCLPMVGGSLRVLQLLPPLKMVAMI